LQGTEREAELFNRNETPEKKKLRRVKKLSNLKR
jgi:hypothetical protein